MENVCRKDLDWLEAAKLKKEIHLLQVAIHGEKKSTAPDAPGWSKRDTADLLGNKSHASVVRDIQLADAVQIFPELAKAKNKDDAFKMLGKIQEGMIRSELASRIEAKTATTPIDKIHQGLVNQYIVGDFFSGIKNVPSSSIDFIELDPPYAIELDKQKRNMDDENYHEVAGEDYTAFLNNVLNECARVMTSSSWIIIWHAKQWRQLIHNLAHNYGLETDEGIWYKGNVGQTNSPNLHLASCFEPFIYARKGNPSIIRQGRSNVFHYKPVPSGKKIHPTERPVELIQDVIQTFCWEGARIVVPFLGSGNSILAAANLGMIAFGWDLAQEYKDGFIVNVAGNKPGSYRSYREEICQS
jgi:site-specific DNA-methyltransferase (adenine-specific)